MHTDPERAGNRRQAAAFAESTRKLLGPDLLPLFTAGTDLLLPASANKDLRGYLGLSEACIADRQVHIVSLDRESSPSEVHVPQVLATAAFLAGRPGAVFRGTRGDSSSSLELEDDSGPWQPVLKPRFGCQFYSEVRMGREGGGGAGVDGQRCWLVLETMGVLACFVAFTSRARGGLRLAQRPIGD